LNARVVHIRLAVLDDAVALAAFAAQTFVDTYGAVNDPEHIAAHVATRFGVAQQSAELRDAGYTTLLLECEGRLAGYAQLRRHAPPAGTATEDALELHRFYLAGAWHGTGVAAQLMAAVVAQAAARSAKQLWLGVWERNPRAIAFYAKQGFADVGATVFMVGPDRQKDRVLVREILRAAP